MKRTSLKRTLVIDAATAGALAAFVLIVAPGLAIVGMLGLLVLIVAVLSMVLERSRARRGPQFALRQDR